jgi:hypothetical protein
MNMQNISIETIMGRGFYLSLGDFLDEFYRANNSMRESMLMDPPDYSLPREQLAYLAATVHKLANDYGFEPPEWVFDERCYLREEPFFGCNATGNLRLLFMYKSPPEFKHRNLFVDENVLVRV